LNGQLKLGLEQDSRVIGVTLAFGERESKTISLPVHLVQDLDISHISAYRNRQLEHDKKNTSRYKEPYRQARQASWHFRLTLLI
jgi:hypothetical protein